MATHDTHHPDPYKTRLTQDMVMRVFKAAHDRAREADDVRSNNKGGGGGKKVTG